MSLLLRLWVASNPWAIPQCSRRHHISCTWRRHKATLLVRKPNTKQRTVRIISSKGKKLLNDFLDTVHCLCQVGSDACSDAPRKNEDSSSQKKLLFPLSLKRIFFLSGSRNPTFDLISCYFGLHYLIHLTLAFANGEKSC